jgi:hypothetical protein
MPHPGASESILLLFSNKQLALERDLLKPVNGQLVNKKA